MPVGVSAALLRLAVSIALLTGYGTRIAALVLAAFTITGPVFADERPPRYDLDGLCDRLALTPTMLTNMTQLAAASARNTGLMPGAANLTGEGMPERYQQFQGAYQQVAPLTSQIDALRAEMGTDRKSVV